MKSRETWEMIVGGVTLAVLAAILVAVYGGVDKEARAGLAGYRIVGTFNRVDGLAIGNPVTVGGIEVGRIEGMELDNDFRVRLAMRIDRRIALPLDTAAAIHTDGLFGSKFVVLDPGGDETALPDGGLIDFTQDSVVVGDLLELIIREGRAARRQDEPKEP
ncbi:MAG: MlaD family protein [Rhodospirillales bacterium]